MKSEVKVLIMLASYNGEKYIEEQILSIINQDFKNWNLLIQDDGSTDNTVEIVSKFVEMDSRIQLRFNTNNYHGPYYNFHSLINFCKTHQEFDFYMFADQDDKWNENKISTMLKYFGDNNTPQLIYADMAIIDSDNNVLYPSINKYLGLKYQNPESFFFSHSVYGCNIMLNRELFQEVPAINIFDFEVKFLSHDNYYAKAAATIGEVCFIDEVVMGYRRHGENVTAKQEYKNSFNKLFARLFNLNDLANSHALTYNQSLYAIKIFNQSFLNHKIDLKSIFDVLTNEGIYAIAYVIRHKISWGSKLKNISRSLLLLFKLPRKYLRF
ncbi:glycosyltransferase family 2 protein [Streptococcus suis]